MSKRDFIIFVDGLKSTLGTLTDDQWKRLLQKAGQGYGLTAEEATEILEDLGLMVINYFEALELRIEDIQNQSDAAIKILVESNHDRLYKNAVDYTGPGAVDRRNLLNKAKSILLDPEKRRKHLAVLQTQGP